MLDSMTIEAMRLHGENQEIKDMAKRLGGCCHAQILKLKKEIKGVWDKYESMAKSLEKQKCPECGCEDLKLRKIKSGDDLLKFSECQKCHHRFDFQ